MVFKFAVLLSVLAYANAGNLIGAPLAYSAAPVLQTTYHGAPALAAHTIAAPAYAAPALAAPGLAYTATAPALTSQHSNIIRSFGNLGQISTYSKTIDTPFSSVRKADVRVSNPGLRIAAAAPALAYSAAPAVAYSTPAIAAPIGVTYSAAPAVSHLSYASTYANYGW